MKKLILTTAVIMLACSSAMAWGRLGHATVAKIAEDHLTPEVKAKITKYLNGKSIVYYASLADEKKNQRPVDYGFVTENGKSSGAYPHTFEVNMDFEPFRGINDNGRYVKNCLYFIEKMAEELHHPEQLSDSSLLHHIAFITHFVGDMHCPEHMRYNPEEMSIGYYKVKLDGKDIRWHSFWDTEVITIPHPWGFLETAYLLDTYTDEQIAKVQQGDVWSWAKENAKASWHVHQIKEGATIKKKYVYQQKPFVEEQLTKAGYRLAKILNENVK